MAEEMAATISELRTLKAREHKGDHGRFLVGVSFAAIVDNKRARQVSFCPP